MKRAAPVNSTSILLHPFCEVSHHPQCPLSEQQRSAVLCVRGQGVKVMVSIRCVVLENIVTKKSIFGIDGCATDFDATLISVTLIHGLT